MLDLLSRKFFFFVLTLLVHAASVLGQGHNQAPYERVLVPILAAEGVPGAYGSLWGTFLTVRNDSDFDVDVTPFPTGICVSPCGTFDPHSTSLVGFATPNANGGQFLYVGKPRAGKVSFSLRVQDSSRQSLSWGTTIPVIREKDVSSTRLQILDVPTDKRFRDALRIYDFDTADESTKLVRVRIGESHSELATVDVVVPLISIAHNTFPPANPAFAMIGSLVDTYPQLSTVVDPTLPPGNSLPPRVRILLDAVSPGLRFWGFVTVTNNETQHVTALLPSQ
jgi:hypothetical protein